MRLNQSCHTNVAQTGHFRSILKSSLHAALLASLLFAGFTSLPAIAEEEAEEIEEIVVTGTRESIQSSIQAKRQSDMVIEVLTADDIGDISSLSIGEALETLTSAMSHRDQGTATEISIRGMGPFLGNTNFNGR